MVFKCHITLAIKPQPPKNKPFSVGVFRPVEGNADVAESLESTVFGLVGRGEDDWGIPAPYRCGDILWARETWRGNYPGHVSRRIQQLKDMNMELKINQEAITKAELLSFEF